MRSNQIADLQDKIEAAMNSTEAEAAYEELLKLIAAELQQVKGENIAGPVIMNTHESKLLNETSIKLQQLIKTPPSLLKIYDEFWGLIQNFKTPGVLFYSPRTLSTYNTFSRKMLSVLLSGLYSYAMKKRNYDDSQSISSTHFYESLSFSFTTEEKNELGKIASRLHETAIGGIQQVLQQLHQNHYAYITVNESNYTYITQLISLYSQAAAEHLSIEDVRYFDQLNSSLGFLLTSDKALDAFERHTLNRITNEVFRLRLQFDVYKSNSIASPAMRVAIMPFINIFNMMLLQKSQPTLSPNPLSSDWNMYARLVSFGRSYHKLANEYKLNDNFTWNFAYNTPNEINAIKAIQAVNKEFSSNFTVQKGLALVYKMIDQLPKEQSEEAKTYLSESLNQIGTPGLTRITFDPLDVMFSVYNTIEYHSADINLIAQADSLEDIVKQQINICLDEIIQQNTGSNAEAKSEHMPEQYFTRIDESLTKSFGLLWVLNKDKNELLNKYVTQQAMLTAQIRHDVANNKLDPEAENDFENYVLILIRQFLIKECRNLQKSASHDLLVYSEAALANLKQKADASLQTKLGRIWAQNPQAENLINKFLVPSEVSRAQNIVNYPNSIDIDNLQASVRTDISRHLKFCIEFSRLYRLDVLKSEINLFMCIKYKSAWSWSPEAAQILNAEVTAEAVQAIKHNTKVKLKPLVDDVLVDMAEMIVKADADITPAMMVQFIKEKIKAHGLTPHESNMIDELVTADYLLEFAHHSIANSKRRYNVKNANSLMEFLQPHAEEALTALIKSGYFAKQENSPTLKQDLLKKFDEIFSRMLGIVWTWNPNKAQILDALVINKLIAIQNQANTNINYKLDINTADVLALQCKETAIQLFRQQEENNYQIVKINNERKLKVKFKALDKPVAQEISKLVDVQTLNRVMLDKFQVVWSLADNKTEMLAQIVEEDVIATVKQQAFETTIRAILGSHFENIFYNHFYKGEVLEYKANETMTFAAAILPVIRGMADEILSAYFKPFPQLWLNHPARNEILNHAINEEFVRNAQAQVLERRQGICKAAISRAPLSIAELTEWNGVLLDQLNDQLQTADENLKQVEYAIKINDDARNALPEASAEEKDTVNSREVLWIERNQLQSQFQYLQSELIIKSNLAQGIDNFREELVGINLPNPENWVMLKSYYQHLLVTKNTIDKIFDKKLDRDHLYPFVHELKTITNEFSSQKKVDLKDSSEKLSKLNHLLKEVNRFESEHFLKGTDYLKRYSKVVPERDGKNEVLVQQFEEAIKLFDDYAGNSFLDRMLHLNRHHRNEARSLAQNLRILLDNSNNPDGASIIKRARILVMDNVQRLLKNGELKADFKTSSFARRASYVMDYVLLEEKVQNTTQLKR